MTGPGQGSSVPQMVPPPLSGTGAKPGLMGAPVASIGNSRSPLQSAPLGNLLSSVKSPQQINIDLKAQLAAIKGELIYTVYKLLNSCLSDDQKIIIRCFAYFYQFVND